MKALTGKAGPWVETGKHTKKWEVKAESRK